MWKNIIQPDKTQITIWRMRIACWIPKAICDTHSAYVIRIAFPLRQWLYEGFSMRRYTSTAPLLPKTPPWYHTLIAVAVLWDMSFSRLGLWRMQCNVSDAVYIGKISLIFRRNLLLRYSGHPPESMCPFSFSLCLHFSVNVFSPSFLIHSQLTF